MNIIVKRNREEKQVMFNMQQVGANIMRCRKAAGMTQMRLADAMGISFQAVSNWERGLSCPDIGRLAELSKILNVSIDDILGNQRAAELAKELSDGRTVPQMTMDEVKEFAPIMQPQQVDTAVGNSGQINAKDIPEVAPYMTQQGMDDLTHALCGGDLDPAEFDLDELIPLAPFIRHELLDELAIKCLGSGCEIDDLAGLAPFLSRTALGALAARALDADGAELSSVACIAPFLNTHQLRDIVMGAVERGAEIEELVCVAPFLSRSTLDEVVSRYTGSEVELDALVPLAPFLSSSTLNALAAAAIKNSARLSDLACLAPFMDQGAMEALIRRIFKGM